MSSTSSPASGNGRVDVGQARWLPDFRHSVKLKYVKLGYHYLITHLLTLFILTLLCFILLQASHIQYDDVYHLGLRLQCHLIAVLACSALAVLLSTFYFATRPEPVYLVDYSCYSPSPALQVSFHEFVDRAKAVDVFDPSSIDFQRKILERSGLGDETAFPAAMHAVPYKPTMGDARAEAEEVMFGALDRLFEATRVDPKEIGVLVVNCSLFNPTPSLSAMIVNRYKLRSNVRSFSLGGMGCSAGVVAVDLAKDMLQAFSNEMKKLLEIIFPKGSLVKFSSKINSSGSCSRIANSGSTRRSRARTVDACESPIGGFLTSTVDGFKAQEFLMQLFKKKSLTVSELQIGVVVLDRDLALMRAFIAIETEEERRAFAKELKNRSL